MTIVIIHIKAGNEEAVRNFIPVLHLNPVVAFGFHPQVLDMACSVQSYYDITGSGGDVYLVKKLAYFEEYLKWAGTEYIYVQAGYLADQPEPHRSSKI